MKDKFDDRSAKNELNNSKIKQIPNQDEELNLEFLISKEIDTVFINKSDTFHIEFNTEGPFFSNNFTSYFTLDQNNKRIYSDSCKISTKFEWISLAIKQGNNSSVIIKSLITDFGNSQMVKAVFISESCKCSQIAIIPFPTGDGNFRISNFNCNLEPIKDSVILKRKDDFNSYLKNYIKKVRKERHY